MPSCAKSCAGLKAMSGVQRPEGVSNAELREVMRRSESHVGNLLNALMQAGQATMRKVPLEGLHKGVCVRWFGGDKPAKSCAGLKAMSGTFSMR